MISGQEYLATDPTLVNGRLQAKRLCRELNDSIGDPKSLGAEKLSSTRSEILNLLLGDHDPTAIEIEPPFWCDYGFNITLGRGFYCNFNCCILDCAPVTIGERVMFGPNVQLYAATHPIDITRRREGAELAFPITIGDDCWIGGNATILAGVTIGKGCVVGAGSVVTKDVEEYSVVVGSPARMVKKVSPPVE